MKSLLQKLIQTPGPSGYEKQVRNLVQQEIEPYADEIQVDPLGNLIVRKGKQNGKGLRVMLAAHIDEIGVIVTHVDENGFARFTGIGGVFPRYGASARVRFLNGTEGVVGMDNIKDPYEVPAITQMYIDVGATSKKDCPVKVGDVAVFERSFSEMGNRWVSKALDDRVGVLILIEVLKQTKKTPHEINFVFSVQEEVGVRGAGTAAFGVNPDLGIAVDVTKTGDTPKASRMDVSLGKGPAIKVRDAGMISDPRVVDWMVKTANKSKIPYQLEILERGSTDARAIQLARAGVPAGCLSIPCRYVHSPSEMVDITDVNNAIKMLLAMLGKPITLK